MREGRLPLYLGARAVVRLDDGPSLVAVAPGMAELRMPLARCSRVVAQASAHVDGAAIAACLRAGIAWVWMDGTGRPLGACVPAAPDPMGWRERVLLLLSRPDWRERYAAWLAAQRRMGLRSLAARFGPPLGDAPEARWLAAFWARAGARARWSNMALRRWGAMGMALTIEFWQRTGVPADAMCEPCLGWHPAADFGACLALDMAAELAGAPARWRRVRALPEERMTAELARAFERRRPRLERLLARMQLRFNRWLLEMQSWR